MYNTIPSKQNLRKQNKKICLMDTKNVYKEAPNAGQKTISTCWVVSPKVIDDVMSTQACLVARRFTEKENQTIRSDTPTCL